MNQHGTSPLGKGGLFGFRTAAAVAAITTTVIIASLGAVPVATSAPDTSCPAAYPVDQLTEGQRVHGLTVSTGTTPDAFSGKVLGVLQDGFAPDLDMILVRLSSSEIDRVGGIWMGMSGSPVYARDGRLIGAVSYGMTWGASPVAGVTPAANMRELLSVASTDSAARTALGTLDQNSDVAIPSSMQREMVASGAVAPSEVAGDMSRLPLPLGISGIVSSKRLRQVARALDMDDVRIYKTGAVSATSVPGAIVAGGNLAASFAYGDVSGIGIGTATAVCADKVLGFGHPMMFSGPSTLTMHGANAIYIQEDTLGAGFKVANTTGPVGGIVSDRRAGIVGVLGETAIPPTTDVTSYVAVTGGRSRNGATHISLPAFVPDMAAFHLVVNQDRVFDAVAGGSSNVALTVSGTRANGTPFSYTRGDRYANKFDISWAPFFDLFDQLWQVQNNGVEDIRFTAIDERSVMSPRFEAFTIKRIEVRSGGVWRPLRTDQVLGLRAGSTKGFRVTLTSAQLPTQRVRLDVPIPARAAGKHGYLEVLGGNSFFTEGGGDWEGGPVPGSADSLDELLQKLASAPRNDDVLANLFLFPNNGSTLSRSARKQAPAVVDGGISVEVQGLPAR